MGLMDAIANVEKAKEDEIVKVVGESISTETEREYCIWVRPTESGWAWLREQQFSVITDILLPTNVGRRRVRITEADKAVMTLKRFSNDGTKEEHSELGMRTALSFFDISPNIHVFRRATLPAPEFKDKGGECKWDIDMFHMYGGDPTDYFTRLTAFEEIIKETRESGQLSEWVKVELEVETFFTSSIREIVPFECSDFLPSRPKDEGVKAFLGNHWDILTNWK